MIPTLLWEKDWLPRKIHINTYIRQGEPRFKFIGVKVSPQLKSSMAKIRFALQKLKFKLRFKQFYIEFIGVPEGTVLTSQYYLSPILASITYQHHLETESFPLTIGDIGIKRSAAVWNAIKAEEIMLVQSIAQVLGIPQIMQANQRLGEDKTVAVKPLQAPKSQTKIKKLIVLATLRKCKLAKLISYNCNQFYRKWAIIHRHFLQLETNRCFLMVKNSEIPDEVKIPILFYPEYPLQPQQLSNLTDRLKEPQTSFIAMLKPCACGARLSSELPCICSYGTIRKASMTIFKIAQIAKEIYILKTPCKLEKTSTDKLHHILTL